MENTRMHKSMNDIQPRQDVIKDSKNDTIFFKPLLSCTMTIVSSGKVFLRFHPSPCSVTCDDTSEYRELNLPSGEKYIIIFSSSPRKQGKG